MEQEPNGWPLCGFVKDSIKFAAIDSQNEEQEESFSKVFSQYNFLFQSLLCI